MNRFKFFNSNIAYMLNYHIHMLYTTIYKTEKMTDRQPTIETIVRSNFPYSTTLDIAK